MGKFCKSMEDEAYIKLQLECVDGAKKCENCKLSGEDCFVDIRLLLSEFIASGEVIKSLKHDVASILLRTVQLEERVNELLHANACDGRETYGY